MYVFATNSLYFQFAVWSQSTRHEAVLGKCLYKLCYYYYVLWQLACFYWLVTFWFLRVLRDFIKEKYLVRICAFAHILSLSFIPPVVAPGLSMAFELAWI